MLRFFFLLSLLFPFAFAEDNVELSDTISGKKAPELEVDDAIESTSDKYEDGHSRRYPDRIYDGAKMLNMSPDFVWGCWRVMEGLYKRDMVDHRKVLKQMKRDFPNSGVSETGEALMWQVLMLENFDFQYEKKYERSFKQAKQALSNAMYIPGNDAWELFLMGAILGVDGIHHMRKEEWITAINQGYEGVSTLSRARQKAPDFIDAQLGDGLWLYWRSLIAMNIPGMAAFKDQRAEGIELIQKTENNAVFLRPASSHALTYIWIEESKLNRAVSTGKRLRRKYPRNIINLQVLGRAQMYQKDYRAAHHTYRQVLGIDPKNKRVHYYMARNYLSQKKLDKAENEMRLYLDMKIDPLHRGWANHHLGHILRRQKRYEESYKAYKTAYSYTKNKRSKAWMSKMDKKRQ